MPFHSPLAGAFSPSERRAIRGLELRTWTGGDACLSGVSGGDFTNNLYDCFRASDLVESLRTLGGVGEYKVIIGDAVANWPEKASDCVALTSGMFLETPFL